MQNRAFSTCQRVLTLSLGVGSMLNVLCMAALAQGRAQVDIQSTADSPLSKGADWKVHRPKTLKHAPLKSAQPKPIFVSISHDSLPSSSLASPKSATAESVSTVEDAATPQFSPQVCQQAACLRGPDLEALEAIAPNTQPNPTAQLDPKQLDPKQEPAAEIEPEELAVGTMTPNAELLLDASETGLAADTADTDIAIATLDPASLEPYRQFGITDFENTDSVDTVPKEIPPDAVLAQAAPTNTPNFLPDVIDESADPSDVLDDELGTLRLQQTRSRENEELGILRLMQTAKAPPPPPKQPIAFLGGRLGFFNTNNAFRSDIEIEEQIYQSGLTLYFFPKVSERTSLYAISEASIARYEVDYNELEVQAGLRHRLFKRTFAQIGWRNQRLYTPGYREKLLGVNYLDALVSHRRILGRKAWADGFYQVRLGFADPVEASRFRQTIIASLNYAATPNLRTSLLYQLEFDDYLNIDRYDISQQILGAVSYNLTPESKISLFGGTRFGNSSAAGVNLDDVFYGAGLNVNVPLF